MVPRAHLQKEKVMQKPEQTMGGKRAAAMATPMMALMPPPVKARDTATPEGAATQNPENKHHAANQSMVSKLVVHSIDGVASAYVAGCV